MARIPGAPLEDLVSDMQRRRQAKRLDYLTRLTCWFIITFGLALAVLQLFGSWRYQFVFF